MRLGYNDDCLAHDPGPRHPESPERLRAIRRALGSRDGVSYVTPSPADRAMVKRVHDDSYVEAFETFCLSGGGRWDPDTVAVEATWDAALASAGIAAWVAETAREHPTGRAIPFGVGRPPGHHAVVDDAMGFCFLNNVAIGADHVIATTAVDSIAIVDWDIHHGNGTQDIFFDRDDVLFVSIHERGLYPGTGAPTETGTGPGRGTTVNVPVPPGSGDPAYLAVVGDLVRPVVTAFDPDVMLVSAGFDAHRDDPISRMRVSRAGYGLLADRMRQLATEATAGLGFVLEGGYNLDVLGESLGVVDDAFGGSVPDEPAGTPGTPVRELIDEQRDRFGIT